MLWLAVCIHGELRSVAVILMVLDGIFLLGHLIDGSSRPCVAVCIHGERRGSATAELSQSDMDNLNISWHSGQIVDHAPDSKRIGSAPFSSHTSQRKLTPTNSAIKPTKGRMCTGRTNARARCEGASIVDNSGVLDE